ncbi:hypothetical protein JR316_0013255 [Psilocybe cubensis]|uniref:Uncharacterized protein n=2 Tax=Psilocybe cubensis TaxID=181762 RepID=A0A8H7XS91_PSICU|nr:hypothetical protein JR316_0013255 [Psilocybe cubensis]KAH9474790.1 hypothetical protein JR316_0013255 [Psilocybe cubensis]
MSYPSKIKPITYADAVRALNTQDVEENINDACGKLAFAMSAMIGKFEAISKQMHTIDLLRHTVPLRPRWDSLKQDLAELLWQFRTNSGVISGRLKLFCSTVLPMATRSLDTKSGRSPYQHENLQVLQSYMSVSAEHAANSRSLAERVFRLSARLVVFLTEYTKMANMHAVSGQEEMWTLSQKLAELETQVRFLFATTSEMPSAGIPHLLFTSARLVCSAGGAPGRSRLTRKPILLDGELSNIGKAYGDTDRKRDEVAHAQYSSQLRICRTNPLSIGHTMISAFLLDEILTSESGLSLYLSIWSRLRTDCSDIFHWVKNPAQVPVPSVISCYAETRSTVYSSLATALDVYMLGIDPSLYSAERLQR